MSYCWGVPLLIQKINGNPTYQCETLNRAQLIAGAVRYNANPSVNYEANINAAIVSPTSSDVGGGTAVTVTGARFFSATSVGFGSTAASAMTVVSDAQIVATSLLRTAVENGAVG